MKITRHTFSYFYSASLLLLILSLLNILPSIVSTLALLFYTFSLLVALEIILVFFKIKTDIFIRLLCLLAYYSVSLSLLYYLFGLTKYSLAGWLIFTFLASNYFIKKNKTKFFNLNLSWLANINIKSKNFSLWPILVIFLYLLVKLFSQPIINGHPSPWSGFAWWDFVLFFCLSYLLVRQALFKKTNFFTAALYFFLIISPLAIRYVLSYGYDTLIHQATLQYILTNGRILPLTPFYIGQYSLELLFNVFGSVDFVILERWLVPLLFFILTFFATNYFLGRLKIPRDYLFPALSVLLLLPSIFSYSSPYALSLLWGILAAMFLFLFVFEYNLADLKIALVCSIASFFVHPFIGLNVLIWTIALIYFNFKKVKIFDRNWQLFLTFLTATIILPMSFVFYNWLNNNSLSIYNPFYFLGNFINVFSDPIWYVRDQYPWYLGLIYFYERINIFLVLFLVLYYPLKKLNLAKNLLFLVSFSVFISAWFFVASFKIDNYFYGDQINYAYRLIQATKWILWPMVLILLSHLFSYFFNKKIFWQEIFIISLSLILSVSWYLSYPRQDAISQMNVNTIRAIDYQAIDFIYQQSDGKDDYLVLSNQIIGAGAILRYGFGPYYQSGEENMLYYSLPWGGKLSQLYSKIMDAGDTNIDKHLQTAKEIMKPLGLNKFYFVYTDAWAPNTKTIEQLEKNSSNYWNIDDKVFIYLINSI